jgi:hypothetical protein
MMGVHVHSTLEVFHSSERITAVGPDAAHLEGVFGAAGGSGSDAAEHFFGFIDATGGADGTGAAERAADGINPRFCSRLKSCGSLVRAIKR